MGRSTIVWMVAAVLIGVGVAAVLKARNDEDDATDSAARIVMLGDSLTEEGNWNERFADRDVVNAGFSGYTTDQLVPIARDSVRSQPLAVFVLTGTNDVYQGQAPSWTTDRLGELVTAIETTSPGTRIVIQTVLPSVELGAGVIATNEAIWRFAADRGLDVLDLYPEFDDGSGALRDAETYDGVHLTALGYDRWASLLRPEFERLDVGSSGVTR